MNGLVLVVQLAVGLLFSFAGLRKLGKFREFCRAVRSYDMMPAVIVPSVAAGLVASELAIGFGHLTGAGIQILIPACLLLLTVFLVASLKVMRNGDVVECMCFGGEKTELISAGTVRRIGAIAAAEAVIGISFLIDGSTVLHDLSVPEFGTGLVAAILSLTACASVLNVVSALVSRSNVTKGAQS